MRPSSILPILLACSILAMGTASPAAARKIAPAVAAGSAGAAGLRGPVAAQRAGPLKVASSLAPILSATPIATSSPADPAQCRLACAHSYYFCLAGEDADVCPEAWTQCLATCGH